MQGLNTIHRVLAGSARRTVSLLTNRQLVAIRWDRMVVQMRVTDLLVLDRTLRAWMTGEEDDDTPLAPHAQNGACAWQQLPYDCTQPYILSLNQQCMLIQEQELVGFCALVAEAVEQLPRRTVRWAELDVQLLPLSVAAAVPSPTPTGRDTDPHDAAPLVGLACLCPN